MLYGNVQKSTSAPLDSDIFHEVIASPTETHFAAHGTAFRLCYGVVVPRRGICARY